MESGFSSTTASQMDYVTLQICLQLYDILHIPSKIQHDLVAQLGNVKVHWDLQHSLVFS